MVKKRTIIAIFITILIVIATNKYWLVFKPMSVDFDIQGHGKCNIDVQLNKKDNDKFDKIKSQSITLDLDKDNHASFSVKRSRFPKRIKIVIADIDNNSPIKISNITFRNGKYKVDDLKEFSTGSGKLSIENNSLYIIPKDNFIDLEYKKTLEVRTTIKFDFKLFVIILVLTYLLACKLSDYVADFKTVKEKSRIDIIFLTIFFVFLFIPISKINQDEISIQENRTLTKWQPIINQDGEINYDFGKNFNEWFNDRFNLRKFFVFTYLQLKELFLFAYDYVEIPLGYAYKKSGWMFYNDSQGDIKYPFKPLTQEQIDTYSQNIDKLFNYCKNQNIKLYIVIDPIKEYLYQEQDLIHKEYREEKTKILINNLKNRGMDNIIYPVAQLEKLKEKELVCYKTDHHLTDSAQFIIYKLLMSQIKQDFQDIRITDESEFNISYNNLVRWDASREYVTGCNYERAGLHNKKWLKTKYKYYDYKNPDRITVIGHHPYYKHINKQGKYKVLLICNSFGESLTYFLNTSFKEIRKYRFNSDLDFPKRKAPLDISGYFPIIEEQKPDILLIVTSTGYIENFNDLWEAK